MMGKFEMSLEYQKRALKIREELGLKDEIIGSLNNLGIISKLLNKPEQALEYYLKANKILKKEITLRKKIESELELRVKDRTIDLNDKNRELQREITERKKAEEELTKHREQLEELITERTKELERYNRLFEDREFRIKE